MLLKILQISVLINLFFCLISYAKEECNWSYTDDEKNCGPSEWGGICQTGKSQSPINLPTDVTATSAYTLRINYHYLQDQDKWYIKNNGHSVQVQLQRNGSSDLIYIPDMETNEKYVFSHMHWHWGENETEGSEHTINNQSFPLEVHFVHYLKKYGGVGESLKSDNKHALSVMGIFFQLDSEDNPSIEPVINMLYKVQKFNGRYVVNSTNYAAINPSELIPRDSAFYRYSGSLTTPSCDEKVLWTVFQKPINISAKQIRRFQYLRNEEKEKIKHNYRPLQPLNDRTIQFYNANVEDI